MLNGIGAVQQCRKFCNVLLASFLIISSYLTLRSLNLKPVKKLVTKVDNAEKYSIK